MAIRTALRARRTAPSLAQLRPFSHMAMAAAASSSGGKAAMPELNSRAVAGSFLFRFPDGDETRKPQVALFRRSGKVRTYQYAPVSGSVEATDASPLDTAWREMREETSLTAASLRLFRHGKPYSFVDDGVGRAWTIHPFSFVLADTTGSGGGGDGTRETITLDWEHEGYDWFDPDDIAVGAIDRGDFPGVPRLLESFRRVWFDIDLGAAAGATLSEGLVALRQDHVSGARLLASKALHVLAAVLPRIKTSPDGAEGDMSPRERWWRNVRFAAWHLWKNGRESMGASVLACVLTALGSVEKRLQALPPGEHLPGPLLENVTADIRGLIKQREEPSANIGRALATFVETHFSGQDIVSIVTLSSSSTVTSALKELLARPDSPPLDIRVLESRPLFEGASMAQELGSYISTADSSSTTPSSPSSSSSSRITVYTDAAAGQAAQGAHLVLLGADIIDRAGRLSNKTGSLPAVLAAKHVSPRVKVVALAEREKVLAYDPAGGHEENDPAEVVQAWRRDEGRTGAVGVRNVYFEWVDAGLVDCFVTEEGVTTREGIAGLADEARARADHFFSDL